MGGKEIVAVLGVSALAVGGAYYTGLFNYLPNELQPAVLAHALTGRGGDQGLIDDKVSGAAVFLLARNEGPEGTACFYRIEALSGIIVFRPAEALTRGMERPKPGDPGGAVRAMLSLVPFTVGLKYILNQPAAIRTVARIDPQNPSAQSPHNGAVLDCFDNAVMDQYRDEGDGHNFYKIHLGTVHIQKMDFTKKSQKNTGYGVFEVREYRVAFSVDPPPATRTGDEYPRTYSMTCTVGTEIGTEPSANKQMFYGCDPY